MVVAPAAGPRPEEPVGGDHGDLVAALGGGPGLGDDRVVAVLRRVHGDDVAVATGRDPALRRALEDQHHDVVRRVRDQQLLVQPPGRTGAVLPPAVRPAADHVGAVDDQDPAHFRNLEKSLGRLRAAAAFS